ncbi:MAG: ExbD/TolR family protein [bacterium]
MNICPRRRREFGLDMTPLIDVVFLLLIFFMVSTTFDRETQLKIDLPKASDQQETEEQLDQVAITVDEEGRFFVNDRELVTHDLDTLSRAIEQAADGDTNMPLVVSSDRNAPFQAAITIMDAAASLQMTRLSFIARQLPPESQ